MLDAACGIGVDALALARRGFVVVGTDGSAPMVAEARRRADEAEGRTTVEFRHSAWLELADVLPPSSFDAVLCVGSSIAHTSSAEQMARVLATFRTLLADDGLLIVDTRDWEATASGEVTIEVEPVIVERDGQRCRRRYRWQQPSAEGPVHLEATLEFLDDRGAVTRSVTNHVRQRAFTRRELRTALANAGFRSIALDRVPGDDRYTATARR